MAIKGNTDDFEFGVEGEEPVIEVQDDMPEEDRGRQPLPKALVDELEADELEEYSDKAKARLKQMRKVWHDERREKEQARREESEAVRLAQRMFEENKRLKDTLSRGEKSLVSSHMASAELEAAAARKAYKDAYESGDSDRIVEAQEQLSSATYKVERLKTYVPSMQTEEVAVENTAETAQVPRPDQKTLAWQERNTWWGTDEEMTASALGLHQKLVKQHGANYASTDDYWQTIDTTMRRRFPEYFGEEEKPNSGPTRAATRADTRPATVVAPASRSTSSKRVVLKQSQLNIAKRLGLTPEQYAREFAKMES